MNNFILLCQDLNRPVSTSAERYLLVYMIGVLFIVSALIIIFFVVFQKRKNKLLIEKLEQQQKFDEELSKTQQEIQEATLKHVGRELHDNIGQLLAVANMQMNAVSRAVDEEVKPKVDNASNALKESLSEVRALSKSLNSDVIFNLGFDKTVANEVERLNKTGLLKANLEIHGDKVNFENKKDEIILFRMLQEFFSNTLKYAQAETLNVTIDYTNDFLEITVKDDGKGFDITTAEKGSGLINIEKRAELIDADINLHSEIGKGTSLNLSYPFKDQSA